MIYSTIGGAEIYWIGLNDKDLDAGWQWTDGGPAAFFFWNAGKMSANKIVRVCLVILVYKGGGASSLITTPCVLHMSCRCTGKSFNICGNFFFNLCTSIVLSFTSFISYYEDSFIQEKVNHNDSNT